MTRHVVLVVAASMAAMCWHIADAATVRGHGAFPRPETLKDGQPPVSHVDTALCFEAAPAVVLTHAEIFLAREAPPDTSMSFEVYEVPRFEGDAPVHPLDSRVLAPQKRWPPGQVGRLLHEQSLQVPSREGRQVLPLKPHLHLVGLPVCCGFTFGDKPLYVPFEVPEDRRLPAWPPVLWAAAQRGRDTCSTVEFEHFTTPRAMSWGVHFELAERYNDEQLGEALRIPACETPGHHLHQSMLLPGRLASEAPNLESSGQWPIAVDSRASKWREACRLAATDDTAFSVFRQSTKRGDIGIISDPFAEDGPLTKACMLREILEDERSSVAEGIGELLWRTAPAEGSPLATIGSPSLVELGGRRVPDDLLWPLVMVKWLAGRFGSLRGFHVLEVGAGFGGLASMVLQTFAVRSYSIVDLFEVQLLQRRFLASVGPRERFVGKASFVGAGLPEGSRLLGRYDLFVSVCAFSELGAELQERYFEQLIVRSERGLIVDNRYTAAGASGQHFDMRFSGLVLMDRLLAAGFHVEAQTWQAMLPSCESCSPLNLVIFYEQRRGPPCHATHPALWQT